MRAWVTVTAVHHVWLVTGVRFDATIPHAVGVDAHVRQGARR
ncbi:MAG: hypothetical protein ACYCV7_02785 [Acidimicrobiales bacterium]